MATPDNNLTCQYPEMYVQDDAQPPSPPYAPEQSGISWSEVAEAAVHAATMAPDAYKAAAAAKTWTLYKVAGEGTAEAADAAALECIAAAGALAIGLLIFAITLEETVYHCGDVCPTCTGAANASIDPQAVSVDQTCYQSVDHGDEHVCQNSHTWTGTPVGVNAAVRGGAI